MTKSQFKKTILDFHAKNRRDLEWRNNITPYNILVSEVMLQQTQVPRVSVKFPLFIKEFPDFTSLGSAAVDGVLRAWQGMGYNRRALYLKKTASIIADEYNSMLPDDPQILKTFPGIGPATACSIVTFAYNKPTVFIETNIRRVFIHFFFDDKTGISDKEIVPLVEETLDKKNPREWYYALMDYGSILSKTVENPNRRSKHYTKQSAFEGSERRVRGEILRILLNHPHTKKDLIKKIDDTRFEKIIDGLVKEGFIKQVGTIYSIV